MSDFFFTEVDKSTIKPGDIILHNGHEITIGKTDITKSEFMGVCLFGDCYRLGSQKVLKGELKKPVNPTNTSEILTSLF